MNKSNKEKPLMWAWHIHHDELVEPLIETLKKRRKFIRDFKYPYEISLRFRLFKKVKNQARLRKIFALPHQKKMRKALLVLHRHECQKNCPWSEKTGTIFTRMNKKGIWW